MDNIEQLKLKHKELGEEIAKLEKKGDDKGLSVLGWEPKHGEKEQWWHLNNERKPDWGMADIEDFRELGDPFGIFKTEAQAETRLALIKALCPAEVWVPEEDEEYWYWESCDVDYYDWEDDMKDNFLLAQGNVHRTREDAEAYGKALSDWVKLLTE